jgi:hypothetical protein
MFYTDVMVQAHYVAQHILSFAWDLINECRFMKSVSLQLVSKIDKFVLGLKSVGKLYLTPCSADTSRQLTEKICRDNYNLLPNNLARGRSIVTTVSAPTEAVMHGCYSMYACWIECALCTGPAVCKHAIPLPNKYWVDYRSSCI